MTVRHPSSCECTAGQYTWQTSKGRLPPWLPHRVTRKARLKHASWAVRTILSSIPERGFILRPVVGNKQQLQSLHNQLNKIDT